MVVHVNIQQKFNVKICGYQNVKKAQIETSAMDMIVGNCRFLL